MAELRIIPKNESQKCGQQQQHHRATEPSVLRFVLLMGNYVKENHPTTLEAYRNICNKIFSVTL
jgi:hypothetical protein